MFSTWYTVVPMKKYIESCGEDKKALKFELGRALDPTEGNIFLTVTRPRRQVSFSEFIPGTAGTVTV